ncbi:MAG: hypothetical protein M3350_09010 [Actinomycetota bacterium]|nr:hypothetical protein [Actinomycetota bacterium]
MTIRAYAETREALKRLSQAKNMTGAELLAALVQRAEEDAELDAMNEDFRRLRADPKAWAEYQAELALWDNTLMDGLEDLDDDWS